MRTSAEILKLVTGNAASDARIRAVLLNGSRANKKVPEDKFQDYDIVYIVDDINSFVSDHSWINIFGERIILQMPGQMVVPPADNQDPSFGYLMLFTDGNRIDLTLFPKEELATALKADSLTVVLLDKDNLFRDIPTPNEGDYLIKKPSEKEFRDACNEFWWVSTYVAKGLCRNEIIYAKEMFEIPVRAMFMKIIEWYIGVETGFSVSFGKGGRFMKRYLSPALYESILSTYADYHAGNIWKALFTMPELFSDLSKSIASELQFAYNIEEERNVKKYLKQMRGTGQ